jgi:hypothetical protein
MGSGRIATIWAVLVLSGPAWGALSPYWVNVPITAAAISNDPALANQQT